MSRSASVLVIVLALAVLGCPAPMGDEGTDGGDDDCALGFEPLPGPGGCGPILPAQPCPVGTTARIGSRECAPVGWTDCGAGFETHPSGWGCVAVLAPGACPGATQARLGDRGCVTVGDCDAPFPPSNATVFVDPTFAAGTLDATHHLTIGEALLAAPVDAVVAVESGTYFEVLVPGRAVDIVGRCPERVVLSPGPGLPESRPPGVLVTIPGVRISGVRLVDHRVGVQVDAGGALEMVDVVVERAIGLGAMARQTGTLSLEDVVVRDTVTAADGSLGFGVLAFEGGAVELRDVEVQGAHVYGVVSSGAGSTLTVDGLVVAGLTDQNYEGIAVAAFDAGLLSGARIAVMSPEGTAVQAEGVGTSVSVSDLVLTPHPDVEVRSWGVAVWSGAEAAVRRFHLEAPAEIGVGVLGVGSRLFVAEGVVRMVSAPAASGVGAGLLVSTGASGEAQNLAIVGVQGYGVVVELDAEATVSRMHVEDAAAIGVVGLAGGGVNVQHGARLIASELTVERGGPLGLLVSGMSPDTGAPSTASVETFLCRNVAPAGGFDSVSVAAQEGGQVVLERSALIAPVGAGLVSLRTPEGNPMPHGSIVAIDVSILGALASPDSPGPAALAGGSLRLVRPTIWGSEGTGLFVGGTDVPVEVEGGTIGATGHDPIYGASLAVVVEEGGFAFLRGTRLIDNDGVALGASAGGSLGVSGCEVIGNAVGIHVQSGSTLSEVETVPATLLPGQVAVDRDTVFRDNDTRVGDGVVALPQIDVENL